MLEEDPAEERTAPDVLRADGRCICTGCGDPYRKHPLDMEVLGFDGEPFLHVLCDGLRVKL